MATFKIINQGIDPNSKWTIITTVAFDFGNPIGVVEDVIIPHWSPKSQEEIEQSILNRANQIVQEWEMAEQAIAVGEKLELETEKDLILEKDLSKLKSRADFSTLTNG